MTTSGVRARQSLTAIVEELHKIPAFARRDLLVLLSYRAAMFSDMASVLLQLVVTNFVGKIVDPATLPQFGGQTTTYIEFVSVAIALAAFIQLGLGRVVAAIRQERLMGTLESLVLTPTTPTTIQLGSVVFDLIYIPVRTLLFLALTTIIFNVTYSFSSIGPATGIMLAFIPFIWGLGVISAAGVITFRRGSAMVNAGGIILTIASGTYFPLSVLPEWLQPIAELNPIAKAIDGLRETLLGGAGWHQALSAIAVLIPAAVISLTIGVFAMRLALKRERRRGTLGLY
jgi:ABC-2 type transport system permease protein